MTRLGEHPFSIGEIIFLRHLYLVTLHNQYDSMQNKIYILLITCFFSMVSFAQDTIKKKEMLFESTNSVSTQKAKKLEYSLKSVDDLAVAKNYEDLAEALLKKGDKAKAEEYLKKALVIYTKKKSKTKIASVTRSLAQVQESQNKMDDAIENYQNASINSDEKADSKVNTNDYNRLKNSNSPAAQSGYIRSNIEILEKEGKSEELSKVYKQKAEADLALDNKDKAIESYSKALEISKNKPAEAIEIRNEMAKVYASDNKIGKAIEVSNSALNEAISSNNVSQQIKQKRNIATLLIQTNKDDEAINLLNESYQLALRNGKTIEAKETMQLLSDYYTNQGESQKAISLYKQFFEDFERMISMDSSLVDAKIFQVTEEKIQQLEKERALKDELITKKNKFNYVLIGSVILMLLLLTFIIKSLFVIKKNNKKIALQSLRREMNPHFIFNSLNSVNQFIAQNNELEANKFLTSYSNLMRTMMETSNKDFITLSNELDQIKKYLNLEHLRFQDKFDYEIQIDESLELDATWMPNMLLQPSLENAIWHGLRYKDEKGLLLLTVKSLDKEIVITIDDNGIGLEKSKAIKTENQKVHQSRGITNVEERIKLLNELYHQNISMSIKEKVDETGTMVTIRFLKIHKVV